MLYQLKRPRAAKNRFLGRFSWLTLCQESQASSQLMSHYLDGGSGRTLIGTVFGG